MSFDISLQVNSSDRKTLDKTITDIMTLSGTLRSETSIIDPVILVNADLASLTNCNYMTIPTFGRSYFVNNIRSIRNGLVEISGHVDVLSTYKAAIRGNVAIINRQESVYNLYIDDGSFKAYQKQLIQTKEFPNGFTGFEYVLAIAGSAGVT